MMKKHAWALWILFAALMFFRAASDTDTSLLLRFFVCGIACFLLGKNGMPSKKYVRLAVLLAFLSVVAYLGYQRDPLILVYGLTSGIPALLTSLAVFSVMEKQGGYALISDRGRHPFMVSIAVSAAAGLVLSAVNIWISGEKIDPDFSPWYLLLTLNPAIFEEMAYRAIFMAYFVFFARNEKMAGAEVFTMVFMMCVPHTVIHGYGFAETLVLCLLFGLPFSLLQMKRDIASAMISHGIVDAVRFMLIGI